MTQPMIDTGEGAQGLLDALALTTMPVPVVGDVAGLASDAYRFATDPESRTLGNAAWASLGLLPFVPYMGSIKGYHATNALFDKFDRAKIGSRTDDGYLGRGFYLSSDPNIKGSDNYLLSVDMDVNNPLKISGNFRDNKRALVRNALGLAPDATAEEVRDAAIKAGFDGVELDYSPAGYNHKEYAVFDDALLNILERNGQPVKP